MADANININIQTQSLDQLNAKLGELQAEIKKVPVGSAEFKRLSAEIRKVDGAVEGANKKLKSLDVGAVAGDIAKLGGAVASSAALFKQFGSEGSDSQQALQDALETTNTILGAGAIAEGVASAARLAGAAATRVASTAQAAYTAVVGTSTGALKAFKIALASTGIGLLVVGIGELIANFDKLIPSIKTASDEFEEFAKSAENTIAFVESSLNETLAEIDKRIAKGASLNEVLEERKKGLKNALEGPNGFIALAEQASAKTTSIYLEQFSYEQELRDKGLTDEEIYQDEKYKKLDESLVKATKVSDDYAAKRRKAELDLLKADKDATNERIAGFEIEAEKRSIAARDNELQLIQIEKDLQQKKLAEMQKAGVFTQQEIAKQQNAVQKVLDSEGKYYEKVKQQEIDAERNFLNARAGLLDLSYEERLKIIDKNQSEELKTIQETSKSTAELQFRTQELNLKYSFERIKLVQEEETKKLELVRDSVTKRLELEQKAAETAGDVEKVKEIQAAIAQINKETQELIDKASKEALDRLDQLKAVGKLTGDAYKKAVADLTKINTEFKSEITKSVNEGGTGIISTAIDSVIDRFDTTLNETITNLGIAADDAEKQYLQAITGQSGNAVDKAFEERKKKRIEEAKAVANATIASTKLEISALEELGKQTDPAEEEKRGKKILDLKAKQSKAELDLVKITTEATAEETQARLKEIEDFFNQVQKYYNVVASSIQALGNIIADQATLNDIRLQEEIETVNLLYDQRFALIDAEEKKLDDLAAAKEKNLTTEEKKRRQLSSERASLEAQQQEELAQLENERANAAADAAIKQANLNFALAVGQIAIDTAGAITKTIFQLGGVGGITPPGAALIAFVAAAGAIQLAAAESARSAAIATAEASRPRSVSIGSGGRVSKAEGGLINGPGNGVSDSVPANLSTGEFVVNAAATQNYLPLLNQINQSGLQGGNPVNPSSGGSDAMLALLQSIDTKLAQPNRSYVVASDLENIQNKQNYINRRSNVL